MEIREATIEDAPILSAIAIEAVEPFKSVDFDELGWNNFVSATTVASTTERLNRKEYFCLCVEMESKVVGYITIRNLEKIYQLFILPKNQRQGLASTLWAAAKKRCTDCSQFSVRSSSFAVPTYKSFGFSAIGGLKTENGALYQLMHMKNASKI